MTERKRGATQVRAAAKAGISERSGRTLEKDACWRPAGCRANRTYRTRLDPFSDVWEREIVPQLTESPTLQATTLLGDLQERHPGRFDDDKLRTLQRRIRQWRVKHGAEREVMFPQVVEPGWQVLCDYDDKLRTLQRRIRQWRAKHGAEREVMFP